jgi:hypothetical protein
LQPLSVVSVVFVAGIGVVPIPATVQDIIA